MDQWHCLYTDWRVWILLFMKGMFMGCQKVVLRIFFPICMTFISFSCLITPAGSSITVFDRSGEYGHPDNREKAISLTIECKVSYSLGDFFCKCSLSCWWKFTSIPIFLKDLFYHEWCWILLNTFSTVDDIIIDISSVAC